MNFNSQKDFVSGGRSPPDPRSLKFQSSEKLLFSSSQSLNEDFT